MVAKQTDTEFYRCPLPVERSLAALQIRRNRLVVHLQEVSIDGFTVLVDARDAGKLQMGVPWILVHDESTFEVHAQWFFHATDGQIQIGLRRLRDLTRPPRIRGWRPAICRKALTGDTSIGSLVVAGMLIVTVVSLALPGIGDALGTSVRIQAALHSLYDGLRNFVGRG